MDTYATAMPVSRRGFLRVTAFSGAVTSLAAACAPAAPQPPSGAPPPAAGAGKPAWQQQWDDLVAAAKQEGKVVVVTSGYRAALDEFEKAFPGIAVEHQSVPSTSLFIPKITDERKANIFSFDAASCPPPSFLSTLKPAGVFDSIRAAIIPRPDVVDNKNWLFGFEYGFTDLEKKFIFVTEGGLLVAMWINTDLVKDNEIKSARNLLDAKWKGKILMTDVRTGNTYSVLASMRKNLGDEPIRQLIQDQGVSFRRTGTEVAQEFVRGNVPIAFGPTRADMDGFLAQGLGKNLKIVDLPEARALGSTSAKFLFNRAPHPNAAKLFINWVMTKEGQQVWSKASQTNSLRTDVAPIQPGDVPDPKSTLLDLSIEETIPYQVSTRTWLEGLVK